MRCKNFRDYFQVIWSPFMVRYGSKKQWMIGTLMLTAVACFMTSFTNFHDTGMLALMLLLQNLFVSILDIAVDAIAVEILSSDDVGFGNVCQVVGYKVGGVIGGKSAPLFSHYHLHLPVDHWN